MSTTTVTVTGMTCGGCAAKVRTEIGRIDGVGSVAVDLADGLVSVESASPIERAELAAAVARAGYAVAG
ncbi:heavy metal-associated domain-containing protein [Nocardia implantans]|uniref:Heavy metal-associated domain-containing protein n=1 Tax=Nocardia implantans TaxID=3108168 RepID=A0ABU6ANE2_9NOCA|nr:MULTISPECIES: heavy metal-associated domain-containing protein [unclassified Nocardia]MBF6192143.1 heavy-metal-associated domain-containing protein [Nocardia beijingensis]MEA3530276.1 heavy metal-associated domain-containing protein [Nocardia sp. CDC192]MEB3508984.1 heavy metal-associated domain-containing protein [Nocardia sp. CDC186]